MCIKNTHFKCLKSYYRDSRVELTHLFLQCTKLAIAFSLRILCLSGATIPLQIAQYVSIRASKWLWKKYIIMLMKNDKSEKICEKYFRYNIV